MKKAKQMFAGLLAAALTLTALPTVAMAEITSIEWGTKPEDGTTVGQPFPAGTGGSANFRIPGIVTLNDGTLVASADARWNHTGDACGLDTIVSRSTDGGENWNYTFANYLGDYGNKKNDSSTAFIDPAVATDGETVYMIADVWPGGYAINTAPKRPILGNEFDEDGNLLLSGDDRSTYAYHLERNAAAGANADSYYVIKENTSGDIVEGYTIDAYFNISDGSDHTNIFCANSPYLVYPTDYLYLTKSEDGGASWSIPSLLRLKKPTEKTLLVGPGRGIVTSTGRIVFTAYEYTDGDRNSACIYSDDGGLTWERGASVPQTSSEAAIVEADGKLYIFTRHGGYNVSEDWGETWSAVITPDNITYNLGCELSAITYSKKIDGKTAIIFSAPSDTGSRAAGKLFVGLVQEDGTISWDYTYSVNGNGAYAYSCLTELNDGSIGLLYENAGAAITYTNIPISDIVGESAAVTGGPWCEDEKGVRINSVQMNPGSSVELKIFSSTDDPEWSVVSGNEGLLQVHIAAGKLTITGGDIGNNVFREMLILSDGTSTMYLPVTVSGASSFMSVNLRMEDVKIYTVADNAVLDTTGLDTSIATVSAAMDKIKIKGITEGTTSIKVGDRVYYITVKNDVEEITLEIGDEITIQGDRPELDANQNVIAIGDNTNPYPYSPVETLTDGKYLIGTASYIVTSTDSAATGPLGRLMQSADFETTDLSEYLWTITKTEDGYTIQDKESKYLGFGEPLENAIASCDVNMSDEPQTLQILEKFGSFSISNGTHYLNNYANANVRAAGWNEDDNNWYFYQTADGFKITGRKDGKISFIIGGTTYNITVGDPLPEEAENAYEELQDTVNSYEAYLDLADDYDTASYEDFKKAYDAAQALLTNMTERDAEKIIEAKSELEEAFRCLVPKEEDNDDHTPGSKEDDTQQNTPANNEGSNTTTGKEENGSKLPDVGSEYSDATAVYQFTSSTASGGTVTYVKPKKKTNKKITIPAVIKVNNLTYKVTEIADSACKGNKKLTQVTIGSNVAKIGKSAFASCKKLKKITIQSSVLKSVGKKAINGIHKKCTVKAPKKKVAAYKKLFKGKGLKSTMKITK